MTPQPFLGLFFHAIGGAAAASFYVPLKFICRWPWESFYLAMGVFAWLFTPWIFAGITTPRLLGVLAGAPKSTLALTFLFGALWGVGAVMPRQLLSSCAPPRWHSSMTMKSKKSGGYS